MTTALPPVTVVAFFVGVTTAVVLGTDAVSLPPPHATNTDVQMTAAKTRISFMLISQFCIGSAQVSQGLGELDVLISVLAVVEVPSKI